MKYETPELKALTPAIDAIQSTPIQKTEPTCLDSEVLNESVCTYRDWE
jgi:hypothetical protein